MIDWWFVGILFGALVAIFLGDLLFDKPDEDFDKDLSRDEQEAEAEEAVDSMRGQLDYMRKDGLL